MRVNTIWRGEENHRKKKQFCNFPLLKGAFQLVGRLLFSVHDLEMITLTSFFFWSSLSLSLLSSPHYNYVQDPWDNLLPTGWMERTWEAGCLFFTFRMTGEFVAFMVITWDNLLPTGWMERTWEAGCLFFHIPNDRKICRIYSHHQKNVLILLQCIAMWEERKIHIVPISLWLSVLYTKFHPSKKKTYFCPRRWQWPLVRHQLAFAFTSESSPFLSSCWLSFIQIYVSKMKDDTLMLCKCW